MICPVSWFKWNRPRSPTNQISPCLPAITLVILPNKLAIAVIAVMSKGFGGWIKLVQAAVYGAKPKIASIVSGDARHVSSYRYY